MWVQTNPNPGKKNVGDCVIRAVSIALNKPWLEVYDELYSVGRQEYDMPNSEAVWGLYLYRLGFEPFILPRQCPMCMTIKAFCKQFPKGTYIIGTGPHAVAVIDGNYYDTWDSGNEIASYYWRMSYGWL